MIYKIAICDDEAEFVASLRQQVAAILQQSGVPFELTSFASGEALLSYLKDGSHSFDLIFLDIYMQEVSGIETARQLRLTNDSSAIIFTTASDRYVFAGYGVQALQYLLKPIDEQALAEALAVDLKRRFANPYFIFKTGGTTCKIPFDEIEYLESTLKSVKLVSAQAVFEIRSTIAELEKSLPKPGFCRCHRGFIVNFKQVTKISAQSLTTVRGTEIPMGKTYARAVNRAFLHYIGGGEES